MASVNAWRGSSHDDLTTRLVLDTNTVYTAASGFLSPNQGGLWLDVGGGVTSGDGVTRPQLKSFVIDLETAGFALNGGTMQVIVHFTNDKTLGIQASQFIRNYLAASFPGPDDFGTGFREPIPCTNQVADVLYRYVTLNVFFTGSAQSSLGFTFTNIQTI